MPELPEVETVKRGLAPYLQGITVVKIIIRNSQLRWPIPADLDVHLVQQTILDVSRRGKYLLFHFSKGSLIIHLGMSGSLRILETDELPRTHDHVDILLESGKTLRYNDPRRFGAMLWTSKWQKHPLLQSIGIEPLDAEFTGKYLKKLTLTRKAPIKSFLMNGQLISGIGNIYAAEALFMARIHPQQAANTLSDEQCETLAKVIKLVLQRSIDSGGTTLRDFINSEGKPGYFAQQLFVYGRAGQACRDCGSMLKPLPIGQRSTVFCPHCQPVNRC